MFQIDFASRVPIYEQLFNNVVKLAGAGVIKPGDKLPPVRIVASQLGINPNTAAKAYRELEAKGYIYSSVGRGSYLTDKLGSESAQKLEAIREFENAAKKAVLLGADRALLDELLNKAFESF